MTVWDTITGIAADVGGAVINAVAGSSQTIYDVTNVTNVYEYNTSFYVEPMTGFPRVVGCMWRQALDLSHTYIHTLSPSYPFNALRCPLACAHTYAPSAHPLGTCSRSLP